MLGDETPETEGGILSIIIYHEPPPACSVTLPAPFPSFLDVNNDDLKFKDHITERSRNRSPGSLHGLHLLPLTEVILYGTPQVQHSGPQWILSSYIWNR